MQDYKCALIIDAELPTGIIANTAAVLALSLGQQQPSIVGAPFANRNNEPHQGITQYALPILKMASAEINQLRTRLRAYEEALLVIDVSDATRNTRSYAEYVERMATTAVDEVCYQGLALYGPKKLVNRYTGNLPLLR